MHDDPHGALYGWCGTAPVDAVGAGRAVRRTRAGDERALHTFCLAVRACGAERAWLARFASFRLESGMKLDLDFVRPRRRYSWGGALLLIGGIVAAGVGVQQYYAAERAVTALERELAMLARGAGGGTGRKADLDQLRARI